MPVSRELKDVALKFDLAHRSPLFLLSTLPLFVPHALFISCTFSLKALFNSLIVFIMRPEPGEVYGTETMVSEITESSVDTTKSRKGT